MQHQQINPSISHLIARRRISHYWYYICREYSKQFSSISMLLIAFFYFAIAHSSISSDAAATSFHADTGKNVSIKIDIIRPLRSSNKCSPSASSSLSSPSRITDCRHLYRLKLTTIVEAKTFPYPFGGRQSVTVELYRDPEFNRHLHDTTDYNIFVRHRDRVDERVDGTAEFDANRRYNSKISFFRGRLASTNDFDKDADNYYNNNNRADELHIFAIGYIDAYSNLISLQAFMHSANALLYLRPVNERGTLSSSSSSNIGNAHLISNENDAVGRMFYEMFRKQFIQQNRVKTKSKRAAEEVNKTCSILIYVERSLFQLMGEDRAKTVLLVHSVFTFANNIFLNTSFNGYEGYGNMLCKLVIEESDSIIFDDNKLSRNRTIWTETEIAKVLPQIPDRSDYCLTFLFTSLPIKGKEYSVLNGLSVRHGIFSNDDRNPNVGIITFSECHTDPWKLYCSLNFAHELAHLWGAGHDPPTEECLPEIGGSFLVSFPFLDQIGSNNFLFSPCSRLAIGEVIKKYENLANFKSTCSKCGNGILEDSEQCDEARSANEEEDENNDYDDDYYDNVNNNNDDIIGAFRGDNRRKTVTKRNSCCTSSCRLRDNATCSPFNHACCERQCSIGKRGEVCRRADDTYCRAEAKCDGRRAECPSPRIMSDGSSCAAGEGRCTSGICRFACPAHHRACQCEHACRICCEKLTQIWFASDYNATNNQDEKKMTITNIDNNLTSTNNECLPMFDAPDGEQCQAANDAPGRCKKIGADDEHSWCEPLRLDGVIPVIISATDSGTNTSTNTGRSSNRYFNFLPVFDQIPKSIIYIIAAFVVLFLAFNLIICLRIWTTRTGTLNFPHSGDERQPLNANHNSQFSLVTNETDLNPHAQSNQNLIHSQANDSPNNDT